jgi:iron-sulfur cluster repair protein YtfE (RIC family)
MSVIDKIAAKVLPDATEEERAEVRAKARDISRQHGWLAMVIDHHQQIEDALDRAGNGFDATARRQALKDLGLVLNGHSLAEEIVLYPSMVEHSEKGHATLAYEEHTATKIQMHMIEHLDPMSQEWQDKLEHIRGALLHHIYHEEKTWLPNLAEQAGAESETLTQRFAEEYHRYAGSAIPEPISEPA